MPKIDTSGWKEFVVGDLFELRGIKQAKSQQIIPTVERDGNISAVPYVVQSRYNNMVSRYVDKQWLIDHDEAPVDGNAIVLGVTLNACSYQPELFGASQVITARSPHLTKLNGFFVATVMNKCIEKFDYKEKPGLEKYKALKIKLPADPTGAPDWNTMEHYMSELLKESETSLENLRQADTSKTPINTAAWKNFVIGDLFEITRPIARSQSQYEDGAIAFVASGNFNNGVTKWCTPKNGEKLDAGNCITVSPLDGSSFYQKNSFLGRGGAGSAILILRNQNLSELSGLFISAAIRKSLTKYNYSDQLNSQTIAKESIQLPADPNGAPDWNYMEQYMTAMLQETQTHLDHLR